MNRRKKKESAVLRRGRQARNLTSNVKVSVAQMLREIRSGYYEQT